MAEQYLEFEFVRYSPSGKTSVWNVVSKRSGDILGSIHWYGQWRCYAFFPGEGTLYNSGCMIDIAFFCDQSTRKQLKKEPSTDGG